MAEVISAADARTMYEDTVCEYNGSLVSVISVENDMQVLMRELSTSKLKSAKFSTDKFKAPVNGRLGYVNFGTVAAFYVRRPRRVYKNGFHQRNLEFIRGAFKYSRGEEEVVVRSIQGTILDPGFESTYRNIYPSFKEAQDLLQKGARLVAFDRQFALDNKGLVYYKAGVVGKLPRLGGMEEKDILWNDEYESIRGLIGKFELKA